MCTDLSQVRTAWRYEFLAYFSTGRISNGPTEAVNLLIKKILRVGHGFRNFDEQVAKAEQLSKAKRRSNATATSN